MSKPIYHDLFYAMLEGINDSEQALLDSVALMRTWLTEDYQQAKPYYHKLKQTIKKNMIYQATREHYKLAEIYRTSLYDLMCAGSFYYFKEYLITVEFDRPSEKKFYEPRARYLEPMVQGYQDLADGKLDLLSISMPKRAGKSQTGINFSVWMAGKYPDRSILMEGTGDALVRSFYDGCLEYIKDTEQYNFFDIFPDAPLVKTNADLKTIDLQRKERFPTIMCRSIEASQVGLSEASNFLYLDDLVAGRQEACNLDLLNKKWETVSGDVMGRALGVPIIMCGTRYSIYDPIGRMQKHAEEQGLRQRIIEIPALDFATDESNYEFYNPKLKRTLFTTEYFREQRELLSAEQFESEFQQRPIEARGALFPKKSMNYYYELPQDREPDCIIAVCDTADKGTDYTSMPVCAVYGQDAYIIDAVFDDAPPEFTKPEVANCIIRNKVSNAEFESNNAGEYYAKDVKDILDKNKYVCNIVSRRTTQNKETKIIMASDNIIKHFYFKHESLYEVGSQYGQFMRNVWGYVRTGKVPHDDAPDSLAMLENCLRRLCVIPVEVMKRPF